MRYKQVLPPFWVTSLSSRPSVQAHRLYSNHLFTWVRSSSFSVSLTLMRESWSSCWSRYLTSRCRSTYTNDSNSLNLFESLIGRCRWTFWFSKEFCHLIVLACLRTVDRTTKWVFIQKRFEFCSIDSIFACLTFKSHPMIWFSSSAKVILKLAIASLMRCSSRQDFTS